MQLDHVFVFVAAGEAEPGGATFEALNALGLVPSYRRRHAGQGTANVCYCFDNAYLELLFVVDPAELAGAAVRRNGFPVRSVGAEGASPFGIAIRGGLPGETWPYRIEGFPPGLAIPVSTESDDPRLPFMFGSPADAPPSAWTDGRAGGRQVAAGLATLEVEDLLLPEAAPASLLLDALVAEGVVGRVRRSGARHDMTLLLGGHVRLSLGGFAPG